MNPERIDQATDKLFSHPADWILFLLVAMVLLIPIALVVRVFTDEGFGFLVSLGASLVASFVILKLTCELR